MHHGGEASLLEVKRFLGLPGEIYAEDHLTFKCA